MLIVFLFYFEPCLKRSFLLFLAFCSILSSFRVFALFHLYPELLHLYPELLVCAHTYLSGLFPILLDSPHSVTTSKSQKCTSFFLCFRGGIQLVQTILGELVVEIFSGSENRQIPFLVGPAPAHLPACRSPCPPSHRSPCPALPCPTTLHPIYLAFATRPS